jgi:hypothetical protein
MSSYTGDESDTDNGSLLTRLLQCSCFYGSSSASNDPTFAAFDEHQRRRIFATRFQSLLGNIQAQAKAQTQHPRDQVFDCVLRLYAHEVSL